MLYRGETWESNASNLQGLRRNDHTMIRWICSAKDNEEVPSNQPLLKLNIRNIMATQMGRTYAVCHVLTKALTFLATTDEDEDNMEWM